MGSKARDSESAATIFACYFHSSLIGGNICNRFSSEWAGKDISNAIWDIRRSNGKQFMDRLMLYTYVSYKAYGFGTSSESVTQTFPKMLVAGLSLTQNGISRQGAIKETMQLHQLRVE
jgi:hypothetical protein